MADKVKEKRSTTGKIKGKIQAAPKELLRRGLLTGTEKLKGQLRDAAEGGRREDTEADRTQDTARMGAHLAVDRLGRLALGKKKARSWSGGSHPDAGGPGPIADGTGPATQAEPPAPYSGTGPVRIKTREAAQGGPAVNYGRVDLLRADQPMVKTKDTYLHRQITGQVWGGSKIERTPRAGEYVQTEHPSQPVIRTKGDSTRQDGMILEHSGWVATPGQVSENPPSHPPQSLERSRQRFVRERSRQAAAQRRKQDVGGTISAPTERQSAAGTPSPNLPSRSVRLSAVKLCGKAGPAASAPSRRPARNESLSGSPDGKG